MAETANGNKIQDGGDRGTKKLKWKRSPRERNGKEMTGADKERNDVSLFISDLIECVVNREEQHGERGEMAQANTCLSGFFIQQGTRIRPNRCSPF
ncbi:hypothetical protein TNCV_4595931 [Trichonephila clavipes]|uniref:Uncharacterized protein n=1 Tax=Trichonephila clavipes TaxID=2585209 RepID=A0A8X7BJU9_TRICX|nr:hypothetical protein TNCV_4595931 [Trichonephila clavipes]